jgi:uncharacterized protein YlbG (UPF0298 family)
MNVIFSFGFLMLFLAACNSDGTGEVNSQTKPVADAPAYNPSSQREGDQLEVKGECIVFYYPTQAEIDTIVNGAQDLEKFMKVVEALKPSLESEGYAVYVSSDNQVQMRVSETRSHLFERMKMVSNFGAVFYSSKSGPYFCEGLRDAENYKGYINRYFRGAN